jgi:SPX domain protein involved in polyphosphate accumulation
MTFENIGKVGSKLKEMADFKELNITAIRKILKKCDKTLRDLPNVNKLLL